MQMYFFYLSHYHDYRLYPLYRTCLIKLLEICAKFDQAYWHAFHTRMQKKFLRESKYPYESQQFRRHVDKINRRTAKEEEGIPFLSVKPGLSESQAIRASQRQRMLYQAQERGVLALWDCLLMQCDREYAFYTQNIDTALPRAAFYVRFLQHAVPLYCGKRVAAPLLQHLDTCVSKHGPRLVLLWEAVAWRYNLEENRKWAQKVLFPRLATQKPNEFAKWAASAIVQRYLQIYIRTNNAHYPSLPIPVYLSQFFSGFALYVSIGLIRANQIKKFEALGKLMPIRFQDDAIPARMNTYGVLMVSRLFKRLSRQSRLFAESPALHALDFQVPPLRPPPQKDVLYLPQMFKSDNYLLFHLLKGIKEEQNTPDRLILWLLERHYREYLVYSQSYSITFEAFFWARYEDMQQYISTYPISPSDADALTSWIRKNMTDVFFKRMGDTSVVAWYFVKENYKSIKYSWLAPLKGLMTCPPHKLAEAIADCIQALDKYCLTFYPLFKIQLFSAHGHEQDTQYTVQRFFREFYMGVYGYFQNAYKMAKKEGETTLKEEDFGTILLEFMKKISGEPDCHLWDAAQFPQAILDLASKLDVGRNRFTASYPQPINQMAFLHTLYLHIKSQRYKAFELMLFRRCDMELLHLLHTTPHANEETQSNVYFARMDRYVSELSYYFLKNSDIQTVNGKPVYNNPYYHAWPYKQYRIHLAKAVFWRIQHEDNQLWLNQTLSPLFKQGEYQKIAWLLLRKSMSRYMQYQSMQGFKSTIEGRHISVRHSVFWDSFSRGAFYDLLLHYRGYNAPVLPKDLYTRLCLDLYSNVLHVQQYDTDKCIFGYYSQGRPLPYAHITTEARETMEHRFASLVSAAFNQQPDSEKVFNGFPVAWINAFYAINKPYPYYLGMPIVDQAEKHTLLASNYACSFLIEQAESRYSQSHASRKTYSTGALTQQVFAQSLLRFADFLCRHTQPALFLYPLYAPKLSTLYQTQHAWVQSHEKWLHQLGGGVSHEHAVVSYQKQYANYIQYCRQHFTHNNQHNDPANMIYRMLVARRLRIAIMNKVHDAYIKYCRHQPSIFRLRATDFSYRMLMGWEYSLTASSRNAQLQLWQSIKAVLSIHGIHPALMMSHYLWARDILPYLENKTLSYPFLIHVVLDRVHAVFHEHCIPYRTLPALFASVIDVFLRVCVVKKQDIDLDIALNKMLYSPRTSQYNDMSHLSQSYEAPFWFALSALMYRENHVLSLNKQLSHFYLNCFSLSVLQSLSQSLRQSIHALLLFPTQPYVRPFLAILRNTMSFNGVSETYDPLFFWCVEKSLAKWENTYFIVNRNTGPSWYHSLKNKIAAYCRYVTSAVHTLVKDIEFNLVHVAMKRRVMMKRGIIKPDKRFTSLTPVKCLARIVSYFNLWGLFPKETDATCMPSVSLPTIGKMIKYFYYANASGLNFTTSSCIEGESKRQKHANLVRKSLFFTQHHCPYIQVISLDGISLNGIEPHEQCEQQKENGH